ncbi:uncharacterized protein N7484_001835 [Penicillium longicatenatum]|uniref:uncharacterized protein n=1 Tax=Penicillium longicatenatum TaxID=1561947 RepID=UPI00254683B1|nr:uncharacterized protein N7484_001835 [Penicillium longicatenatum]KAJ5658186.1 hypothetical protein N7484_001835 [Penicillium longicatenatum]
MSEKHWGIVMRTNSLLCGVHPPKQVEKEVTLPNGRTTTIPEVTESIPSKKAYYPAFAIKPRPIASYDITFSDSSTSKPDGFYSQIGLLEEAKIGALTQKKEQEEQETKFHIPRFHINDKTNIDIFETQNSHEKTVADAGYTQDGFSAAVGGSYGPVGGGVSGGFNKTQKTATTNTNSRDKKHLHVTYNYPRVKLQLDEDQLELSQECKADIHKLRKERTQAVLDHFYRKYGEFFEPEIYLGGRLFSSEESDSVAGSSLSEKITGLKAAAGLSISGYGVQAKVDYTHENNTNHQDTVKSSSFTQTISWCADGGDTTLCNNPSAWCSTVASFYNWRVMQRTKLVSLIEHIAKLPDYTDVPFLVRNIANVYADKDYSLFAELGTAIMEEMPASPDGRDPSTQARWRDGLMRRIKFLKFMDEENSDTERKGNEDDALFDPRYHSMLAFQIPVTDPSSIVMPQKDDLHPLALLYPKVRHSLIKKRTKRVISSLILRKFKFGVKYPVVCVTVRFDTDDEDEEKGVRRLDQGYGIQMETEGADGTAQIHLSPGKGSNCMIEFRRSKEPQNTSGSVSHGQGVSVLLYSLEDGNCYSIADTEGPYMFGKKVNFDTPGLQTLDLEYSGEEVFGNSSALQKKFEEENEAIEEITAKYQKAADARKAVEDAETATEQQKEEMKAAHQLLLMNLEKRYFPDWIKQKEVKLRLADNTGGEKGQKMRDDVKAQQITVTNVLEMLALAMVPGTSLQSVIDIMKDDPDLKPYANYVWYSVVGGGDGRGPQIITSLSGMPLLFYPE